MVRRSKSRAKDETTLRVPAGDPHNEAIVIASVITNEKYRKKYLASIPPDSFYSPKNAAVWTALQEMWRRKLEYSADTLVQLTGYEVEPDYLEELIDMRDEVTRNVDHHVELLKWDRARVELGRGPLSAFLEAYRNPRTDPERLRTLLTQCSSALSGFGTQKYIRSSSQLVAEQRVELTRLREGVAIYPFGIPALDYYAEGDVMPEWADRFIANGRRVPRLIPGAYPGMFTVVTGLSGTCKSTTTARAMLSLANQGRKIGYGAWEMEPGMTLRIMAAMSLEFHRTDIMTGNFSESQQNEILAEMDRIGEFVKFFELPRVQGERKTNDASLDLIHQLIADSGCEVFVADLLRKAIKETRPDDIEHFVDRMQAIGQETKCHIIAVHQLKGKDVEASKSKLPRRDLLKGSSAWYEIPDQVIAWHRPGQWKNIPDDKLVAFIFKQRYGKWPLAVEIDYDDSYGYLGEGRSIEVDREEEQSSWGFEDQFLNGN